MPVSKRETSKSKKGVALLHASLALDSKDLLQNSPVLRHADMENFWNMV